MTYKEWSLSALLIDNQDVHTLETSFVTQDGRGVMRYHARTFAIDVLRDIDSKGAIRNLPNKNGLTMESGNHQYTVLFNEVVIDGERISFDDALKKYESFKAYIFDL